MDSLFELLPLLIPLALLLFLASEPSGAATRPSGSDADPLAREIDEESRRQSEIEQDRAA